MLKIKKKIKFTHSENRMQQEGDVRLSINSFDKNKNKNLFALLKERFDWMNDFIQKNDKGIEVGAAAGFSKLFIKSNNFKISDYSNYSHLDYKNIDAQNTKFDSETFDFVIASNMIHHIPYPIKFFREVNRILKKGGKFIAKLERGASLGEMALLDHETRSADALAEKESVLLKIDQDVFYELMEGNADIMKQMIRLLTSRIREANSKLEQSLK